MTEPTTADRIASCAYRHWKRASMTEWPTVRVVCRRLRINQRAIDDCEGDGPYITSSYNVHGGQPRGDHFVEAMTDEVDRDWDAYWARKP